MFRRPYLIVATATFAAACPSAAEPATFERDVLPFFENHCFRCHGDTKQKGDFRIDSLDRDVGGGTSVNHWLEVIEQINTGEMPPDDEENLPTPQQRGEIVEWLAARIKEGEAARLARREDVSFHRLTREEYRNTIYDLLGVNFDVTDPTGLAEDDDWNGFERIGSALSLAPSHVEKYFAAAETILAEAFPETPPESSLVRKNALDLRGGPSAQKIALLKEQGIADKVRVDIWPGHQIQGGRPGPGGQMFKTAGDFNVRIQVSGLKPENGLAPHLSFYADKLDRMLFQQDIVAPENEPVVVEFQTHLPAGNHTFVLSNDVPGPSVLPRSGRSGDEPFFSIAHGRIPWQLKLTDEEGKPLYPFLIVDWIEWEGPIVSPEAKAKRDGYFPTEEGNFDQVRSGLALFVERAIRRPAIPAEIDRYVRLAESEAAKGADFFQAVKTAMVAVLCSKDFLYLVEGNPGTTTSNLNAWELASRLSYFLWGTMPDTPLFALARDGKLLHDDVLRNQVARMLADPKAERFKDSFPRQWLHLKKVGMFAPDSNLYPDYDKYLELSMVRETTAFFAEVLEKNLPLHEFISSNWTMLNPRLAAHYGIPGVAGDRFQKIALAPEHRRGGILTHASVLSLTSDGTRHRPVHRGVWVSESIFGKSPPPPPANVDPIEPNPSDAPKATIRMKLEAHTHDPNCASCHSKIDPLGFAFDNYDAIGRWRSEEIVPDGIGSHPKVDPSGTLPDGRSFADAADFKNLLLDDIDAFNATFVEKLATFALRRAMTVDDRAALSRIADESKSHGYRTRSVVEALVLSDLFRSR